MVTICYTLEQRGPSDALLSTTHKLSEFRPHDWRDFIGYAAQNSGGLLEHLSIRENILLGLSVAQKETLTKQQVNMLIYEVAKTTNLEFLEEYFFFRGTRSSSSAWGQITCMSQSPYVVWSAIFGLSWSLFLYRGITSETRYAA